MKKLIAALAITLALFSPVTWWQSEAFKNPDITRQRVCENETKIVLYVLKMKVSGVSKERMLKAEPLPAHWSKEQKARVMAIIDQVYASHEKPQKYAYDYFNACMKRVTL